jgi:hypothetical protein
LQALELMLKLQVFGQRDRRLVHISCRRGVCAACR